VKQLTREQIEGRKEKAVRFTRDVVGDPERADDIADESLESYAERRKFEISNPNRTSSHMPRAPKTIRDYKAEVDDLKDQVSELEEENEALAGQLDEIQEILEPEEEEEDEEDEEGE
jgi:predicted RNase H-like nuclease (RuvC/YqgF family)